MRQWSFFLCGRYLRRKRIVLLSISAVMLCCALLITVASLFTGFIHAFEKSESDYMGDVVLIVPEGFRIEDFGQLLADIEQLPTIEAATPALRSYGLLLTGPGQVRDVQVLGIDLSSRLRVSPIRDALLRQKTLPAEQISFDLPGKTAADLTGGFVGIGLVAGPDEVTDSYDMRQVEAFIGQKAVLTAGTPANADSQPDRTDAAPRLVRRVLRFTISDVIQTGVYRFDQNFIYVPIESLSSLLYPEQKLCADAVQVRLKKGADEEVAAAMIRGVWRVYAEGRYNWADYVFIGSSRQMQARLVAEFYKQLDMLMMIFGIVSFAVVLLVFCIFYMIVMTKQKDIGVVKSCGASGISVAGLYFFFGIVNGAVGSALGAVLGWLITVNIELIEKGITATTGLKIWKASTYMFDRIPSEVNWDWALWICLAAVVAAAVGSLIPAAAAARVEPVKILRYE